MTLQRKTPLKRTGGPKPTPGYRFPRESPKTIREKPIRAAVREAAKERDGGCVGPRRGLPGRCGPVGDRTRLEVHEVASRGTHPGSHLKLELTATLCPVHHSAVTSAVGEARELAIRAGLIVLPST